MKASRIASVVRLLNVINLKFSMHGDLQVSLNYIVTEGCQSARKSPVTSNSKSSSKWVETEISFFKREKKQLE